MLTSTLLRADKRKIPLDAQPWFRSALALGGGALTILIFYSLVRYWAGIAPRYDYLKEPALILHLLTAIPAVPLGAYIFLTKKGGPRHKLLGRIWMILMLVTASAAFFLRGLNQGSFSFIHLFVLLVFLTVPQAYLAIRRGDVRKHRDALAGMYLGACVAAGFSAFMPGRTMWVMAFG